MKNWGKTLFIILAIYLGAMSLAYAKDYKLTKDEFLSRVEKGDITLDRTPVLSLPPDVTKVAIEGQKKEFPGFREEMWYVGNINSNKYTYFIFFEWYGRGCIFGMTEPAKYKGAEGKKGGELAQKENDSYEKIDKKYCEKALGITIHNSGGLPRINVPRNSKPPGGTK